MSTNKICLCGEIRKIFCGYPILSGAMYNHGKFAYLAAPVSKL